MSGKVDKSTRFEPAPAAGTVSAGRDATRRYRDEIGAIRERVRQIQVDALQNLRCMMEQSGISGDAVLG